MTRDTMINRGKINPNVLRIAKRMVTERGKGALTGSDIRKARKQYYGNKTLFQKIAGSKIGKLIK